jgi:hypothetical protein
MIQWLGPACGLPAGRIDAAPQDGSLVISLVPIAGAATGIAIGLAFGLALSVALRMPWASVALAPLLFPHAYLLARGMLKIQWLRGTARWLYPYESWTGRRPKILESPDRPNWPWLA